MVFPNYLWIRNIFMQPGTVTMEPMQQKNIFTGSQKTGNPQRNLRSDVIHSLIDGRIYYLALKSKSEDGMNYSEDTGTVMSMKTDGTDKKKVAQIVNSGDAYRYSLFQSEGKIYYTKENENKTFYDLEGNSYQREFLCG